MNKLKLRDKNIKSEVPLKMRLQEDPDPWDYDSFDYEKELRKLGLQARKRPEDASPQMPLDATVLTDEDLGSLMSRYAAWISYAMTEVTKADLHYGRTKNQYVYQKKRTTVIEELKNDAAAEVYPEVTECHVEVEQARAKLKMLEALLAGFKGDRDILSRDLSRRLGDKDNRWRGE